MLGNYVEYSATNYKYSCNPALPLTSDPQSF